MKRYLSHYTVEAGQILGCIDVGDHYAIIVDCGRDAAGTHIHERVNVAQSRLNYTPPPAGAFFLRGEKNLKGEQKIEIMPAGRFRESHAMMFENKAHQDQNDDDDD